MRIRVVVPFLRVTKFALRLKDIGLAAAFLRNFKDHKKDRHKFCVNFHDPTKKSPCCDGLRENQRLDERQLEVLDQMIEEFIRDDLPKCFCDVSTAPNESLHNNFSYIITKSKLKEIAALVLSKCESLKKIENGALKVKKAVPLENNRPNAGNARLKTYYNVYEEGTFNLIKHALLRTEPKFRLLFKELTPEDLYKCFLK
jgi:hypothetical protein